jgi:two-component system KDP operon response regulator KdpE
MKISSSTLERNRVGEMDEACVTKPKVLLVDNEKGIVNFLKLKLKISGFDVAVCSTGEECLKMLPEINPDIMLLDIGLPGIDGIEVLRRMRKFSDIPVIILSGRHSAPEEAVAAGATAFIRKPFDLDELLGQMKTLL